MTPLSMAPMMGVLVIFRLLEPCAGAARNHVFTKNAVG